MTLHSETASMKTKRRAKKKEIPRLDRFIKRFIQIITPTTMVITIHLPPILKIVIQYANHR
jgi:hypothetical protein